MDNSYKSAGVDKEAGYTTIQKIKNDAKATQGPEVLNNVGDFAALYALAGYTEPILVSGTDGVGTKLMLAKDYDSWEIMGVDCFAMCANDILCHGAKPLFFLDYLACGHLDPLIASRIIKGLASACKQTGTALVGGETAEMPGMYQKGDYDIAGFCVGIVERKDLIESKKNIEAGDAIIGIASSGTHSNGYSLIRHLIKNLEQQVGGKRLIEQLLTPTKIYVDPILNVIKKLGAPTIKGAAHITGGGVIENIPRILDNSLCAHIDTKAIPCQPIYEFIKNQEIDMIECWNTFNMGVGFVLIVEEKYIATTIQSLKEQEEVAFTMGYVQKFQGEKGNIKLHF